MKFNKQIAIILVLASLLLTSLGIAFYFWSSGEKIKQANNQLVTVFIAKGDIKKDTLITEQLITQTAIAKQYVLTKPLVKQEIIGKYAKEPIYKNEMFLKEKLVTSIVEENDSKILEYKYNTYNMKFNLFQNPNYAVQPDDWINIISVYSNSMNPDSTSNDIYSVQYVAENIKILGFLNDGTPSQNSIQKKKVTKVVNKQKVEETIDVKATDLLLDIEPKILLKLIDDYNKGKQLWMVKVKKPEIKKKEPAITEKITLVEDEMIKIVDLSKRKVYQKQNYPIKWYDPNGTSVTKSAMIEYIDDPEKSITAYAKINLDFEKACSQRDKLLLVTASGANLRNGASIDSKVNNKVNKNYILPYNDNVGINKDWYQICDGSFVHKSTVKEVSFVEVLKLIEQEDKMKRKK